MKPSEERKENETNSLKSWIDHLKDTVSARGVYIVVGALALVVGGILLYRYWSISRANAYSALVLEFNVASTDQDLDEIIKSDKHVGKGPASWAKLQKARLALFPDGLSRLGSFVPAERDAATTHIEESHKRYEEVAKDDQDAALKQEAFIALAMGEECLLATPKQGNSAELRGSFDAMIEFYRKAAEVNRDSPAGKRYAAKADDLKAKRKEIEAFYRRLNELSLMPGAGALPRFNQ
jgi:predicted negative regulator of RcsB-dependent stress response